MIRLAADVENTFEVAPGSSQRRRYTAHTVKLGQKENLFFCCCFGGKERTGQQSTRTSILSTITAVLRIRSDSVKIGVFFYLDTIDRPIPTPLLLLIFQ